MLEYVPILGRLRFADYIRVVLATTVLVAEPLLRVLVGIFTPVGMLLYRILGFLVGHRHEPPDTTRARSRHSLHAKTALPYPACGCSPSDLSNDERLSMLYRNSCTEDMIRFWRFPFQEHYFTTRDGYIIALHRIPSSRQEHANTQATQAHDRKMAAARNTDLITAFIAGNRRPSPRQNRPVVLLWHGFMMCSEVWVCHTDINLSLAFTLADAGYDVWLGNTRGNKYSCKHTKYKSSEEIFWDFSMDHLALYDLPDAVDYILAVTEQPSLTYVGFSQGTAQGFSSLAINPQLNKKINLFIALAPAAKPRGLTNSLVSTIIGLSPEIIYLMFGKRSMMSSSLFWHSILDKELFAFAIKTAVRLLFKWTSENIKDCQIVFSHLYSYTSVKCVVHWFQIINRGRFQMYDESPGYLPNGANSGHLVPKFPTQDIQTPIALFYGGQDTLADMKWLLKETSSPIYCLQVEEYEHICFLWANGLDRTVIPAVLGLLDKFAETWPQDIHHVNAFFDGGEPQLIDGIEHIQDHPHRTRTASVLKVSSVKSLEQDGDDLYDENGDIKHTKHSNVPDPIKTDVTSPALNQMSGSFSHAPMEPTYIEEPHSRDPVSSPKSGSSSKNKHHHARFAEATFKGVISPSTDSSVESAKEVISLLQDEHDSAVIQQELEKHIRTVPHIGYRQIRKMLELGMPKVVDDGRVLVFDGVVSYKLLTDQALTRQYNHGLKSFDDLIEHVMDQIKTRPTAYPLKTPSGKGGGRVKYPSSSLSYASFDGFTYDGQSNAGDSHVADGSASYRRRRSFAGHEIHQRDDAFSDDDDDDIDTSYATRHKAASPRANSHGKSSSTPNGKHHSSKNRARSADKSSPVSKAATAAS